MIRLLSLSLLFASATLGQTAVMLPAQVIKLRSLVSTNKSAARQFERIKEQAEAALKEEPNPAPVIASEGKLKGDPAKIATRHSLEDMGRAEALGWAFAVTGDSRFGNKARAYVLAWARTNEPDGDPINETKLEPMLTACDLVAAGFQPAEKQVVDAWVRKIADALAAHQKRASKATSFNNWHSHRLKITGLCGWLLADKALIDRAVDGYREQIGRNLQPDGSSFDFHERDALHYHCYDLEPLLTLAMLARVHGIDLYSYTAANGASLGKAVAFLVPYCDGSQTHAEFVNSKVAFDKKRAEDGDGQFTIGHPFDPKEARESLLLASAFDPQFLPLYLKVAQKKPAGYASWQIVLNSVR